MGRQCPPAMQRKEAAWRCGRPARPHGALCLQFGTAIAQMHLALRTCAAAARRQPHKRGGIPPPLTALFPPRAASCPCPLERGNRPSPPSAPFLRASPPFLRPSAPALSALPHPSPVTDTSRCRPSSVARRPPPAMHLAFSPSLPIPAHTRRPRPPLCPHRDGVPVAPQPSPRGVPAATAPHCRFLPSGIALTSTATLHQPVPQGSHAQHHRPHHHHHHQHQHHHHHHHNAHDVATQQIAHLRRLNLSLLLDDLLSHVRHWYADHLHHPPLQNLYARLGHLRHALRTRAADDPTLRASIRHLLWLLRQALEAFNPPMYLRASLERARSASLDIPRGKDDAAEIAMLREQIALGTELSALRTMEERVHSLLAASFAREADALMSETRLACTLLGKDDYRVRGKRRLVDALANLRATLCQRRGAESTCAQIEQMEQKLIGSFENDLKLKRPVGSAMLLRPGLHDIPNFDVVHNGFLRGGQPSASGLQWLYNYGVHTVVDLRGSDRLNQWCLPDQQLGLSVCNIPVEDFSTPSFEQVQMFCSVVQQTIRNRGVIFAHCKAGIGRTGTFVACWRIANGEDVERALGRERLYCDGGGGLKQETFVRDFARYVGRD